ncbi:putative integral membrane protein (TIGR00698 family) [Rhodovulum iodosum]|uniref:Integral membrane protein (TIGR00698 family) n=1 Tax=Rhodovulum iodosum TaxID=68291 RepID=A0ABV3XW43_9RHOB|nr:YeiH family protein [Rhodovulum robiginosum]RSK36720.1 YeiH family putative sulfate export transporter [Rhodovulum robiginosum]
MPSAATALSRSPAAPWAGLVPGVVLCATVAAAAFGLRQVPGIGVLSPMILSIVIGMALHNLLGTPAMAKPGVTFTMRRILRAAIVLLGLQLTLGQVVSVGATGLAVIAAALVATFLFTKAAGRMLGVDRGLAELIGAGTSICGASAVIACNTVTRAHDEDVAYAVACVTVFGSLAMFLYPMLAAPLGLAPDHFGLWAGASIHEVAQVVAAGFQRGEAAGEAATVAKLSRVMMLAPLILTLAMMARTHGAAEGARVPTPWFVFGFIAMMLVASVAPPPAELKADIVAATTFLLSMALAAMGLETDLRKLRAKGLRPLALGAVSTLFIAVFSLTLVKTVL